MQEFQFLAIQLWSDWRNWAVQNFHPITFCIYISYFNYYILRNLAFGRQYWGRRTPGDESPECHIGPERWKTKTADTILKFVPTIKNSFTRAIGIALKCYLKLKINTKSHEFGRELSGRRHRPPYGAEPYIWFTSFVFSTHCMRRWRRCRTIVVVKPSVVDWIVRSFALHSRSREYPLAA